MKKIILSLCLVVLSLFLKAQVNTVYYTYDVAGNRVSRTLVITGSPASANFKSTSEEFILDNETKITLYPNPTKGILIFNIEDPTRENEPVVAFKIYSLSGSLILEQKHQSSEITIDISNEPDGTYLLDMYIGSERKHFTVIKQ